MSKCRCESILCDHPSAGPRAGFPNGDPGPCPRPADDRFQVDYVGTMCTQCVSNMCSTGGSMYIELVT